MEREGAEELNYLPLLDLKVSILNQLTKVKPSWKSLNTIQKAPVVMEREDTLMAKRQPSTSQLKP